MREKNVPLKKCPQPNTECEPRFGCEHTKKRQEECTTLVQEYTEDRLTVPYGTLKSAVNAETIITGANQESWTTNTQQAETESKCESYQETFEIKMGNTKVISPKYKMDKNDKGNAGDRTRRKSFLNTNLVRITALNDDSDEYEKEREIKRNKSDGDVNAGNFLFLFLKNTTITIYKIK